jgi:two-component system sensor histidine kinase GlrK
LAQGDFAVLVDESGKDELAELAAHFNVMVSKLRELDQLKGDFVSHVSHELKAPLASMQETTRLLMDEIPGGLNEKQRRLLKLNLACGERLSEMIKNLLDLSKIEADAMQYQFEISDLAATVEMAVDEFRGLAGEKNLSLEIKLPDEPALIPCDEERCLQVLGNLISNAIKFSDRGKSITVEIQCLDTPPQSIPEVKRHQLLTSSKRFCVISVRDRGRGVSDKDKERIFERFFVLTKGRKNLGQSTGLGLAISRRIAEAHRGLLWVEDNPGGGSVFHFLLPDRVI